MNIDMFRFRVRDKENKTYLDEDCLWLRSDGYAYEGQYQLSTIDFIVERCTGLKDKNGNLIYDGDVVRYNNNCTGTVRFKNGCFVWQWGLDDSPICGLEKDKMKIIGNIHEMEVKDEP